MANKIFNAFDCVKMDPKLKESTKRFLSAKRSKKSIFVYQKRVKRAMLAMCSMLLLTFGIVGHSLFLRPVSYVSIDVNPSIELALNRLNRVVAVTSNNEEGKDILKDLSLKGQLYTNAIDAIINCEAMRAYLTDEVEVFFTVAADQSHEYEIKTGVESYFGNINQDYQYNSTKDIQLVMQAHKYGLSLGKYYLYLKLCQYDNTITLDDCKQMSMSEIHHLMRKHEQGKELCPIIKFEDAQEHDAYKKTPSSAQPQKETASPVMQEDAMPIPDNRQETPDVTMKPSQENASDLQQEAPAVPADSNQDIANNPAETEVCTPQPTNNGSGCIFIDNNQDGFCDNGDIHSHNGEHVDNNQDGFCDYGDRYCMKGGNADSDSACDYYQSTHEGGHQQNTNNQGNSSENTDSGTHHSKKHKSGSHRQ